MSDRIVLALSGWKSSGKDTVADYLVREHGWVRASFADALKLLVAQQYGIPLDQLHDPAGKEAPLPAYPAIAGDPFSERVHEMLSTELRSGFWTPRAICILEGSMKRAVHPNYWVRTVLAQIIGDPTRNYVISDMRYRSEADTCKLIFPGVRTVRLDRFDSIETRDPSERDLDNYKFDYTLPNRGTKELLYDHIDGLLDKLNYTNMVTRHNAD
jgi:hypothetical protein